MASQASLDALAKTEKALRDIHIHLKPFLHILSPESGIDDPNRIGVAQTAVALSLGTLRYMGNRLRGSSQGKNPKDPLRLELNRMRQTLVQVQKKQQSAAAVVESVNEKRNRGGDDSEAAKPSAKRYKS